MKTSLLAIFLMVPTCLAMPYVASADLIFDSAKVHRAAASQHADVRRHISTTRTPSDSRLDASAAGTLNRKDRKNGAQTASRNAAETGNGNTDIFDAHLATSTNFATTFTGTGKEGFVFRLDTPEAAVFQPLLDGLTPAAIAEFRIAISAVEAFLRRHAAGDATGGPETFNVGAITGEVAAVPEPSTLVLAITALFGSTALAWRRRVRTP